MTPAELVACVVRLHQRAAFADNAIYHENDQKAYEHARAAFHEAGRLLDFCAPKTCGTCAAGVWHTEPAWTNRIVCHNPESACCVDEIAVSWPADHGCPHWRAKERQ